MNYSPHLASLSANELLRAILNDMPGALDEFARRVKSQAVVKVETSLKAKDSPAVAVELVQIRARIIRKKLEELTECYMHSNGVGVLLSQCLRDVKELEDLGK